MNDTVSYNGQSIPVQFGGAYAPGVAAYLANGLGTPGNPLSISASPLNPVGSASIAMAQASVAATASMIVAQRASIGTHYDYKALPSSGIAHVYRCWPEKPDDPKTPSGWYQAPEEYAVGYAGDSRNSGGGVALGYGYKSDGTLDFDDCEDAIFFTGDMLRSFRKVMDEFLPDGPLNLFGLQIGPKGPVRGFNVPPSISYFVNYRDSMRSDEASGTVGNVAVYRLDCAEMTCAAAKPGGTVLETYAARPVPPMPPRRSSS